MAIPTAVDSQITDSVTQSNVKVLAEAPAFAMGSIYQAVAHSTGLLFENAVAAQQQQNALAQAAANQGVMQIYSLNTTAAAGATEHFGQAGVSDNITSLLTMLNAFRGDAAPKASAVAMMAPEAMTADVDTTGHEIVDQIQAAVKFSNDAVLGNAHAFVTGLHSAVDAMAHGIETMNRISHANLLSILQESALSVVLGAMIREPEKAEDYAKVLQAIKQLA